MDFDIKTIAAFWGAILSSWLFFERFFSSKPSLMLEPMSKNLNVNMQFYNLHVKNDTDFPINFHYVRVEKPMGIDLTIFNAQQASRDFVPENILVYPGVDVVLRFDLSGHEGGVKIVAKWEFMTGRFGFTRYSVLRKSADSLNRIRNLNEFALPKAARG